MTLRDELIRCIKENLNKRSEVVTDSWLLPDGTVWELNEYGPWRSHESVFLCFSEERVDATKEEFMDETGAIRIALVDDSPYGGITFQTSVHHYPTGKQLHKLRWCDKDTHCRFDITMQRGPAPQVCRMADNAAGPFQTRYLPIRIAISKEYVLARERCKVEAP